MRRIEVQHPRLALKIIMCLFCVSIFSCSNDTIDPPKEKVSEEQEEEQVEETGEESNEEDEEGSVDNNFPRLSDDENLFYIANIPNNENILTLSGEESSADSDLLNAEIETLSDSGGGVIRITGGTYYLLSINPRSNVHLKFDADVTILPDLSGNTTDKNLKIFEIGETFAVENFALTSTQEDSTDKNNWFKVVLPTGDYRGLRFIELGFISNFKISGVRIEDSYSVHSSIVLNLPASDSKDEIANQGIIKDIVATAAHVGYGIIQLQAGTNILCKNLDGEGGIPLRIETGATPINKDNQLTVDNIVGRDIKVSFGDGAVVVSPHRVDQGRVDVERITAVNSTYAVRLSAGFLDNRGTLDNIGTFNNESYFGDITVTGGDGAQVKGKDFKFFNRVERERLQSSSFNPDEESKFGKSIGAISDNSSLASGCSNGSDGGCYEVNVEKIVKTNDDFENGADYIYGNMAISPEHTNQELPS